MSEKTIWSALLALTDGNAFGAAGLMGNLYAESALNSRNLQQSYEKKLGMTDESYTSAVDDSSYSNFIHDAAGYGLAQWTYWSRKAGLLMFAREQNASIGDESMQLAYLAKELSENYSSLLYTLKNAISVRIASDAVLTKYEKPADQSESVKEKRASYGQRYYDKYAAQEPKKEEPVMENYDKYILSTGTHYISNSGKDENNQYHGGAAGDQSGHEWELKAWYNRPWTVVLRWPDASVALLDAKLSCAAALNNKIGYDQYQRTTYWTQLAKAGYDPSKITTACEEDCTAGVTANWKAVGYLLNIASLKNLPTSVYSGSMRSIFEKAGFKALTASKYLTGPNYLLPGDVLLYEGHHAAANVSYGKYVRPVEPVEPADPVTPSPTDDDPAFKILAKGDKGSAVKAMQKLLLEWNEDCLPKYGADGSFGNETKNAIKDFQEEFGLDATGRYDEATAKALEKVIKGESEEKQEDIDKPTEIYVVKVTGASVNVRTTPGLSGNKVVGIAKKNQMLSYRDESKNVDDRVWYAVVFDNKDGWISGKYSELVKMEV